jgi:hypothetical protein
MLPVITVCGICRQVHNPPTAEPIILSRRLLEPCDSRSSDVLVGPESIKSCYQFTHDSLQRLRGVSPEMSAGRTGSSKQQLLQWRPYLKQVCVGQGLGGVGGRLFSSHRGACVVEGTPALSVSLSPCFGPPCRISAAAND